MTGESIRDFLNELRSRPRIDGGKDPGTPAEKAGQTGVQPPAPEPDTQKHEPETETGKTEQLPEEVPEGPPARDSTYPLMRCRLFHLDFGSDFRVYGPNIGKEDRREALDRITTILANREPEGRHMVVMRQGDVMITGWVLRMETLETRYDEDDSGSKVFGFLGMTRSAEEPVIVPSIGCVTRLYNSYMEGQWEALGLEGRPRVSPVDLQESDIESRPQVKKGMKEGVSTYYGSIDCVNAEDVSPDRCWTYVSDVANVKMAKDMKAEHCTVTKRMGIGLLQTRRRQP